jgi:hypothetical protein
MLNKDTMRDAAPHIERAHRCLEMLAFFAKDRKLSLKRHIPGYFDILVESVIELQRILVEDKEYTELVGKAIAEISKFREYSYNVTQNNQGEVLYSLDAMLPHKEMKRKVLFSRRNHYD